MTSSALQRPRQISDYTVAANQHDKRAKAKGYDMLESLQRKQVLCVTREINNQADSVALPPHSLKSKQVLLPPLHPLGTGIRGV